ncbi:kinase-like protein [Rhizopogon salebrosus TDB-379]|nr:kinase-like protein [Rhizopogon salebrosus TDB-379]
MKFMILFKTLANVFRHIPLRTRQVQPLPLDDETRHQRVRDLTGQLFNIPSCAAVSGGYSDVWKCDWIKDGAVVKVAAKAIRRQSTNEDALCKALKRHERELEVWMRLRHEHVLPLYGVAHEFLSGRTVMVCPWLENGPVTSFIASHHDMNVSRRLKLVSDVAAGLRYLHSQSIVHGDLTGSNVLVCVHGRAHLADFGLSKMLAEYNSASHSVTGATRWAAPELIDCSVDINIWDLLSPQSDMYSFGSIMFHILADVIPYHELQNSQVAIAVFRGEKPARLKDSHISNRQWGFIQSCWLWIERRDCRPSADDAHAFLRCERGLTIDS